MNSETEKHWVGVDTGHVHAPNHFFIFNCQASWGEKSLFAVKQQIYVFFPFFHSCLFNKSE